MLAWGSGDRFAPLLHGMLGAATQYHQLGPAPAAHGYRAVVTNLPGTPRRHPAWSGVREELGFCVRAIPRAGHSVWYGRMDDFVRSLDGWL
ncbi:hypothetical protein JOF29_003987 [Kribbella aluminosa]|uniref:Alpha/beta hydrolase n=1 Tax=Kribbella aluminosa TaxID=416017 RepID=A0ABS4UMS9_9ACTN|nr:hypothetical protein [Kribbella aluminosa]MBP2352904.1 hypothetical protein [Kribbella aluminosa]